MADDVKVIDESDDIVRGEDTGGKFDAYLAIVLGLAAIAAAWSAFQSGSLSGDALTLQNKSIKTSDEASQQYTEGTQQVTSDTALFLEYAKALQGGETDTAEYLKGSLMDDNLVAGVDWWAGTDEDDDSADSPFVDQDPDYTIDGYDEGARLDTVAEKQFDKAGKLGNKSGKFDLTTVLLAVALFMFGVSSVFRVRSIRLAASGVGTLILVVSLIRIIDLGYYGGM
ncbi:MAG: hypothetical protein JWM98_1775 [Thermoleophilia bacterium]|nr:hypothetical protein [Thermoleophilia bacterium]